MGDSDFWDTMKILVGKEFRRNIVDDVQEWVDKVVPKRAASVHEEEEEKYASWNRRTSNVESEKSFITDDEIIKFKKSLKLPKIECKFVHPFIRFRLERLMGTQITNLTDRDFMLRFQERLLEDYEAKMEKRLKEREFDELERIKNLVLSGTIPVSSAPKEMMQHPVMLIDTYCNKLIAARRAKIKIPKVKIPTFLYWDDTPDQVSGLNVGKGHVFRAEGESLCLGAEKYQTYTDEEETTYSLSDQDYDRCAYMNPLVKNLLACDNVKQLYSLAHKIIGALRAVDENTKKIYEDMGSDVQIQTIQPTE